MRLSARTDKIRKILRTIYPDVKTQLFHDTPFQLLVATVLSAQCTDKQVNRVTRVMFNHLKAPADFSDAPIKTIEGFIRSTGFYHNKARNIKNCSRTLLEIHDGRVPQTLEELVELPGVGRKTANVVLNVAFGEPTMAVDTHIFRLGNRTGLAPGKTPLAVELKLLKRIPDVYMVDAHHWLILHGRYVCVARNPKCGACAVSAYCDYTRGKATQ